MDDCKSTSSYVFSLGNDVINYNNKKETFIVMSSTKIEYMAALQTTKQVMWLLSLFGNIGVPQMKCIVIYDDNQSYIVFHARMQRIEIHHHLV